MLGVNGLFLIRSISAELNECERECDIYNITFENNTTKLATSLSLLAGKKRAIIDTEILKTYFKVIYSQSTLSFECIFPVITSEGTIQLPDGTTVHATSPTVHIVQVRA